MWEEFFGSFFSGRPFCSNGTKTDLHTVLLKAMIASEDQKEKFACALQNACSVIKRKGSRKTPMSESCFRNLSLWSS